MTISAHYICVEKIEKEAVEGFQTVEVQDDFVYKGKITHIPGAPTYIGNKQLEEGDVVLFAKYSPDTHTIEIEDKQVKFVSLRDVLAVV